MSKPPPMEELARRYMDLWEQQLATVAGDAAIAEQIGRLFQAMAQMGPAALLAGGGTTKEASDGDGQPTDRPLGTAAAGSASERGVGDMDELARRVAHVEERIAALERRSGRKSRPGSAGTGTKRGG